MLGNGPVLLAGDGSGRPPAFAAPNAVPWDAVPAGAVRTGETGERPFTLTLKAFL